MRHPMSRGGSWLSKDRLPQNGPPPTHRGRITEEASVRRNYFRIRQTNVVPTRAVSPIANRCFETVSVGCPADQERSSLKRCEAAPPLDRHPPDGSVGPHDPMHAAPFSSAELTARFQARVHRCSITLTEPIRFGIRGVQSICGARRRNAWRGCAQRRGAGLPPSCGAIWRGSPWCASITLRSRRRVWNASSEPPIQDRMRWCGCWRAYGRRVGLTARS